MLTSIVSPSMMLVTRACSLAGALETGGAGVWVLVAAAGVAVGASVPLGVDDGRGVFPPPLTIPTMVGVVRGVLRGVLLGLAVAVGAIVSVGAVVTVGGGVSVASVSAVAVTCSSMR